MSATPHDIGGTDRILRVVYCGFPDVESARRIGDAAVVRRLAACVNRFPIDSTYHWKGAIEHAAEVVALFKTSPRKVGALFAYLAREHPYDVPDIFELPVARVHRPYLEYLAETLEPGLAGPVSRRWAPTTRPESPRARAGRGPRRIRGRPPRPSKRTGTPR